MNINPRASGAKRRSGHKPVARVTNSEIRKSSDIMCRFGLVSTFDLLADVIKFRGWTGDQERRDWLK